MLSEKSMLSFCDRREIKADPERPSTLARFVFCLWGILGVCLFLLILFSGSIRYAGKQQVLNPVLLTGLAVVFEIGLYWLARKIRGPDEHLMRCVVIAAGLFFLIQVVLVATYFFRTGWDVRGIIKAAEGLANGDTFDEGITEYLSQHPNNILLVFLFSKVFSFGHAIGAGGGITYFSVLVLQCCISALTGIFTYLSAFRLTGSRATARFSYVIYLLLIGLSPWVSIPYSDSMGLLFPVFVLWLYLQKPTRTAVKRIKWAAIGFLAYIGYKIKPTVLLVLIALLLVEAGDSICRKNGKNFAKGAGLALSGLVLAGSLIFFAQRDFAYQLDPEQRFGVAHFLAMGLNEERMGVWSGDDVNFSASFHTKRERDLADLNLARQRIHDMGIAGVTSQFARKTLTNFNDGTFAWMQEGDFFWVTYERTDPLSGFVRSFYYADGSNVRVFRNTGQAIWLSVVLFAVTVCFTKPNKEISAWILSLIGLMIYGMLFEARARYVYIFAPVFIVCAVYGFQMTIERFRMRCHMYASR